MVSIYSSLDYSSINDIYDWKVLPELPDLIEGIDFGLFKLIGIYECIISVWIVGYTIDGDFCEIYSF